MCTHMYTHTHISLSLYIYIYIYICTHIHSIACTIDKTKGRAGRHVHRHPERRDDEVAAPRGGLRNGTNHFILIIVILYYHTIPYYTILYYDLI